MSTTRHQDTVCFFAALLENSVVFANSFYFKNYSEELFFHFILMHSLLFCCCDKAHYHDKLTKERACLGLWFQRVSIHNDTERMATSIRHLSWSRKLNAHTFNPNHKYKKYLNVGQSVKFSNTNPVTYFLQASLFLLNTPKQIIN